jgi:hypothetical protein
MSGHRGADERLLESTPRRRMTPMRRVPVFLLYAWSSPTVLLVLLGLLPLWALGQVRPARIREGAWEWEVAPGTWFHRRYTLAGWAGTALSWLLLFSPGAGSDPRTARHERRHLLQSLLLGPLYLPVYLLLLPLFGYRDHPMEVDARRQE